MAAQLDALVVVRKCGGRAVVVAQEQRVLQS